MKAQKPVIGDCLVHVAVPQLALDLDERGLLRTALCLVHRRG
jgi:hypothetical protein